MMILIKYESATCSYELSKVLPKPLLSSCHLFDMLSTYNTWNR